MKKILIWGIATLMVFVVGVSVWEHEWRLAYWQAMWLLMLFFLEQKEKLCIKYRKLHDTDNDLIIALINERDEAKREVGEAEKRLIGQREKHEAEMVALIEKANNQRRNRRKR